MKFCPHCGASVAETHRFCAQCGQALLSSTAVQPPPAAPGRDHHRHVKLLAVLLLVWGGLGLLAGLGLLWVAGTPILFGERVAGHILSGSLIPVVLSSLGWVFLGISLAAVVAGIGLLDYEWWARPLALVVCIIALLRFPFGTVLGIYGLWVLMSATGERHYQQMATGRP